MQVQKPIYRRKRFWIAIIALGLIFGIYSLAEFRSSDSEYKRFLAENGYDQFGVDTVQSSLGIMRYIWAGEYSKPLLVMVHGSPSSSSFWKALFKDDLLRKEFQMVAVDRPGYGYSDFGQLLPDLSQQAHLMAGVIKKLGARREVFVLASSYGGSSAARLAMLYPELIEGLVFQSSSLIPNAERTYAFTHWTKGMWISRLLPSTIRMANEEKLGHARELMKIQKDWDRVKAHTVLMHGADDKLVFPENAFKAHELLTHARSRELRIFEGRGHDLYWTRRTDIRDALIHLRHKALAYHQMQESRE